MQRTRIKICGITRVDDALTAVAAGADAIGLVFYAPSPRYVEIEQARAICAALPPFVTVVGLFVNADESEIRQVLSQVTIDLLQFHGDESEAECLRFGKPYMKALRMRPEVDIAQLAEGYSSASAILLDTYRKGVPGGTGESFNWDLIPEQLRNSIVLAGGLSASNAFAAVEQVRPYALDVSGGVESAPGVKCVEKIKDFVRSVRRADSVEW